jgi:hypothetical protein
MPALLVSLATPWSIEQASWSMTHVFLVASLLNRLPWVWFGSDVAIDACKFTGKMWSGMSDGVLGN